SFTVAATRWCTTPKALDSDFRWCATSRKRTAAMSRSRACRSRAASSPSLCRFARRSKKRAARHEFPARFAAAGRRLVREGEFMATTKILIVEDEPNMVAGLRDNFEFEGFQVATALDGIEGLEQALRISPDLVILDVMMPRMSGLDVCKQLKAKRPSIPIIML